MKCVCISCFDYYATRMKNIISFFEQKGYDVTYIITDFQHFSKEKYGVDYENTVQINVPAYKKNMSLKRLYSHVVFSRKVYKLIYKIKPEFIYCMIPPNSLVRQIAKYKKQFLNTKVVYDCYDMWPESFPYGKYKKIISIPLFFWQRLRDKNLWSGNLLLTVSNAQKEMFLKTKQSIPIKVMQPMISESELPKYSFNTDKLTFCYLGNINHITDINLGVRLLSELNKRKPVILHIIGGGQNLDEFSSKLEMNGITVVKHGVVFDENEKRKIFEKCIFGLNIPKAEIRSSMSLKSIEYMHMGLPYINSGEGDNFHIIDRMKIGFNIQADNLDEVVKEVIETDTEDLNKMSKKCISYYRDNFLNQNVEQYLKNLLV